MGGDEDSHFTIPQQPPHTLIEKPAALSSLLYSGDKTLKYTEPYNISAGGETLGNQSWPPHLTNREAEAQTQEETCPRPQAE